MLTLANCDPHFLKEEKYGHVGKTVKVDGKVFVACKVVGAAPHTTCPFYQASAARNERERRQRLVESGEYGQREDLGRERLGFNFVKEVKGVGVTRLRVKTDTHLCKLAYGWKVGGPSEAKVEQDRRNSEEGDWVAAERRAEEFRVQNEVKRSERKARREERKARRSDLGAVTKEEKVCTRFDTCEKEVRTGWVLPPGGGLKGGAPGSSSRVSTL